MVKKFAFALLGGWALSLALHQSIWTLFPQLRTQGELSISLAIQALVIAPQLEEIAFRRYIDPLFASIGFPQLSCFLFALAHLGTATCFRHIGATSLVFFFLVLLSLRNQSLYRDKKQICLPILSHLGFNLCSWILYTPLS